MIQCRPNVATVARRWIAFTHHALASVATPSLRPYDNRKTGFTLIETIIAMSLLTVLMAIVWTMFGVYTKLESKGVAAAEESALVRAINRQLRSDLLRMIAIDQAREFPLGDLSEAPNPRYPENGFLIGSENQLRFLARTGHDSNEFADVLHVITYRPRQLVQSGFSQDETTATSAGIDRLDRSWVSDVAEQQQHDESSATILSSNRSFSLDKDDLITVGGVAAVDMQDQQRIKYAPDQIDEIPEMRSLQFEYFDGTAWTNQWDSIIGGRLPLAIRVAFDLEMDTEEAREQPNDSESDPARLPTENTMARSQADGDRITIGSSAVREDVSPIEYQLTIVVPAAVAATAVPAEQESVAP